jgi:hypothetical protein
MLIVRLEVQRGHIVPIAISVEKADSVVLASNEFVLLSELDSHLFIVGLWDQDC